MLEGMSTPGVEPEQLQAAIAALEAQRATLGDATVDALLAPARARLAALQVAAEPAQALRQVSILFLDVVGSTALSQHLGPEAISAIMDGALARGTALVQAHGGRVLQYAGDNLLAVFGADAVAEDDAERAVRCGLALATLGTELGREVLAAHGHAGVDVRVGIHTGGVLLGGGVDAAGTIRGMAVNVAARMEQSAPPGSVRVSMDTWRMVQGLFEADVQPALQVKGVAAPLLTCLVRGERARHGHRARRGVDGLATPMVGRAPELARLQALAATLQAQRSGGTATVLGEAGLGKSRLLQSFVAALGAQPGVDVLQAAGHLQGQNLAFGLLRGLLFEATGVQDSDDQAQAQARWAAALEPVFGERTAELGTLLGQLVGLDYATSPHVAGIAQDGRQLRARGLHALAEWLRRRAARRPQILLLDDLHWADDDSLDAIDHLAQTGAGAPVLLVCASRPLLEQRRPGWGAAWSGHQRIELAPLSAEARDTLAQALLQRLPDAPAALRALIVGQAEGNPFYMEALLQMLVDQGVIDAQGDAWQLRPGRLQGLQVPATLVGVLQARLDALPAPARRALQQASVVGALFWDQALAALDAGAPGALPQLCDHRLTHPSEAGTIEDAQAYAFAHHLLHQVTYGTVLQRDKARLHLLAAQWLQARSAGRGAETAGLVAEHYERAGVRDRAAEHWAVAAQEASRVQADSSALAYAQRALAQGEGLEGPEHLRRRFALVRICCGVHLRRSETPELLATLTELETLADTLDDDVLRLVAAQSRVTRLCAEARFEEAVALGERWRHHQAAERAGRGEVGKLLNTMSIALARMGRAEPCREVALLALEHAQAAGDRVTVAAIHNNLGLGHLYAGHLGEAERELDQARQAYLSAGSRYGAAITRLNLALINEQRGQMATARGQLESLLHECREIGQRYIECMASGNLAFTLHELGHDAEAWPHTQHAITLALHEGDRYLQANSHGAAALAAYGLCDWARAIEHAGQAALHYEATHGTENVRAYRGLVASARLDSGDLAGALQDAQALLAEVEQQGGWQAEVEGPGNLWRVLSAAGDTRAEGLLATTRAQLEAQADRLDLGPGRDIFLRATALRRQLLAGNPREGAPTPP
jgi:class 3 adenylate cyclase/tetratricopeptide (TPR) repeat protein